ncbi:glycoside hydrolase family 26 protein [Sinomicrobium sp. M5D2P9]
MGKGLIRLYSFGYPVGAFLMLIFLASCKNSITERTTLARFSSDNAVLLLNRLEQMRKKGVAFGQQDAPAYGVGWKSDSITPGFISDVHKITGDQPLVYGFDIGHIELNASKNLDSVPFHTMRLMMRRAHEKGGIITVSWHADHPGTGKDSWDTTRVVHHILKGGDLHGQYKEWLKRSARFLQSVRDKQGRPVPVIFRPYHEMNGNWFWWGGASCSADEYKQLYRELVYTYRHEFDLKNILFAYSPNTVTDRAEFLKYYPGDCYVDILGVDIYNHEGDTVFSQQLKSNIDILRKTGDSLHKPYALTETGNIRFGQHREWWTRVLYPAIRKSGLSWALVWRNYNGEHFFSSYPGEITSGDFKDFYRKRDVLFLSDFQ